MAKLTINVVLDISEVRKISQFKEQTTLLRHLGEQYAYYLRERFIKYSQGEGNWKPLEESTIKSKTSRGYANDPTLILRETGAFLQALWYRIRGKTVYVGYNRAEELVGRPEALISATRLANIQQQTREIVVPPDEKTKKKLVEIAIREYNKEIKRNRKR